MDEPLILVVDDNPMNLKLAQITLSATGHLVQIATDAEEALELIQVMHPRLILLDVQLPGMDGLELTRRLKADPATKHIIVIALTAYAMKGDEEKAFQASCDGYVSKPIDTRTLPMLVDSYLDKFSEGYSSGGAAGPSNFTDDRGNQRL